MEGFGIFITLLLAAVFAIFSLEGFAEHFLMVHLNKEWQCTNSIVISDPGIKPIVEECAQYTKQLTK